MKTTVVPLSALAAVNTVTNVNHDDPLGGHNGPALGAAHARNTIKTSSASGGIAGFNPD